MYYNASISEYALLDRERHAPGGDSSPRDAHAENRTAIYTYPRRYGRLEADRARPAYTQSLHRHAELPRPPRMGQPTRYGKIGGGLRRASSGMDAACGRSRVE